jgi:ubiquinone/menaquinone biosynthesis C-methylase UbiE
MAAFGWHPMYPNATHDEQSRQNFIRSMRGHVLGPVLGGTSTVYEARAKPAFTKAHRRGPATPSEAFRAMQGDPYTSVFSALVRTTQEMLYDTVGPSIARQLPELIARAESFRTSNRKLGSLTLDPGVTVPRYNAAADIHCKPGGYHSEIAARDLLAGAEYDRSINVFYMGTLGRYNDDMGRSVAQWINAVHADLAPRRILDLGCTIGHSTLPYVEEFPGAEVHAIDVAAPCLRYGHARAEAMRKRVHFSQQNAERTRFADGEFDLVVSHLLMHETSNTALRAIFRECHRILRPGGLMVHLDGRAFDDDPFDGYFMEWLAHYNNEPFLGTLMGLDLPALIAGAGFPAKQAFALRIPSAEKPTQGTLTKKEAGTWFVAGARK